MPTQKALIFRYILVVAKIRCIIRLFCIGFTTELYDGMNLKYPTCIGWDQKFFSKNSENDDVSLTYRSEWN